MNTNIDTYLFLRSPAPKNLERNEPSFSQVRTAAANSGGPISMKKSNPSAAEIPPPCTECGKTFRSAKALYGHMRCHPQRQWRGINPPPTFRRPETADTSVMEEDREVAVTLLMLANGPAASDTITQQTLEFSDSDRSTADAALGTSTGSNSGQFECSSCKKVFGSQHALEGHRASHKNVKGCFAITKNDEEEEGYCCGGCHLEKVEEPSTSRVCELDLNWAPSPSPPLEEDDDSSSDNLALDLRLGF